MPRTPKNRYRCSRTRRRTFCGWGLCVLPGEEPGAAGSADVRDVPRAAGCAAGTLGHAGLHAQPALAGAAGRRDHAKKSLETRRRLHAFAHKTQAGSGNLAPVLQLNNPDLSWKIFTWMEATSWRHLPSELLEQPDWLMDDLFALSADLEIIKKQT